MTIVAMNDFARRRHLAGSAYSHYRGSFQELCALVEQHIDSRVVLAAATEDEPGEVVKITLPGEGFFSAVVQAKPGMEILGRFEARRPDEYPYFSLRAADGDKVPAEEVDIILYSRARLAIKGENSTDADWEIVSINAKRTTGEEPPHPVTMMRNQKSYPGGTPTQYTAEQWADAVEYWMGGGPQAPFVMLATGE